MSLLMRSSGLSLHVGSLYLGAAQTDFGKYLLGSVLGLLPIIIPFTIMGTSANDPSSPVFLTAFAVKIAFSALSLLIAFFLRRREKHAD